MNARVSHDFKLVGANSMMVVHRNLTGQRIPMKSNLNFTSASSLSPSDKARLHQACRTPSPVTKRKQHGNGDAVTVCKEMSRLDPHYDEHVGPVNPFESMLRCEYVSHFLNSTSYYSLK